MDEKIDELILFVEDIIFQIEVDEWGKSFLEQSADFFGFLLTLEMLILFFGFFLWFLRLEGFNIEEDTKFFGILYK